MASRECQVWAIHKKFFNRLKERIRYGHKKHICVRWREFAQEHEGDHRCRCGLSYPKGPTDND